MPIYAGLGGSSEGEASAGDGESGACSLMAPVDWLSVMGGEFGRLGRK